MQVAISSFDIISEHIGQKKLLQLVAGEKNHIPASEATENTASSSIIVSCLAQPNNRQFDAKLLINRGNPRDLEAIASMACGEKIS